MATLISNFFNCKKGPTYHGLGMQGHNFLMTDQQIKADSMDMTIAIMSESQRIVNMDRIPNTQYIRF